MTPTACLLTTCARAGDRHASLYTRARDDDSASAHDHHRCVYEPGAPHSLTSYAQMRPHAYATNINLAKHMPSASHTTCTPHCDARKHSNAATLPLFSVRRQPLSADAADTDAARALPSSLVGDDGVVVAAVGACACGEMRSTADPTPSHRYPNPAASAHAPLAICERSPDAVNDGVPGDGGTASTDDLCDMVW
jgi:hypothetical protein